MNSGVHRPRWRTAPRGNPVQPELGAASAAEGSALAGHDSACISQLPATFRGQYVESICSPFSLLISLTRGPSLPGRRLQSTTDNYSESNIQSRHEVAWPDTMHFKKLGWRFRKLRFPAAPITISVPFGAFHRARPMTMPPSW